MFITCAKEARVQRAGGIKVKADGTPRPARIYTWGGRTILSSNTSHGFMIARGGGGGQMEAER